MPFICLARTDIPDSVLQVTDLWPNTSSRNYSIDPPGQTKYLRNYQNGTVVVSGAGPIVSTKEASGLTVYLMDNVFVNTAGDSLTPAEAAAAAATIIAALAAGTDITKAVIDAALVAASTAGTEIDANNSTGSVAGVLQILAGGVYTVPAGSEFEDGGNAFTGGNGSFTGGVYRPIHDGVAFRSSLAEGQLSKLKSASFSYEGTAGAAIAIYGDDGTAL